MILSTAEMKQIAAAEAVKHIENGMLIGLGTGSSANLMIAEVARKIREEGLKIEGAVATSKATAALATELKIPLLELNQLFVSKKRSGKNAYTKQPIDLTIDGADEVTWDADFETINLIKGRGGALLHEKVVASVSKSLIIIGDEDKYVDSLAESIALPVEVMPFALEVVLWHISTMGLLLTDEDDQEVVCKPSVRMLDGKPYTTDHGHCIVDVKITGSETVDFDFFASLLSTTPGVVEDGLFLGMATTCYLGKANGSIRTIQQGEHDLMDFDD
ncbi:MAG: ribose-5-phosphate isomerase RpiA [Alphaproteobacteria bacterium]|nr:ribose-5-phosphate isomerase RpiA [Alphaproteobacteria bacterium]